MPRPGGNPALRKHKFKTKRKEPLSESLNLRITASMREALNRVDDYAEFCRDAIAEKLQREFGSSASSLSEEEQLSSNE